MKALKNLWNVFVRDPVLTVSLVLAIASAFWIPPGAGYLAYIDWRVLALLLSLMLVVAALGQAGLFDLVMAWLLQKVRDTRTLAAVLVGVCFFAAMLITNDVALITFVPLTLLLTEQTGTGRLAIPVIVLQTVAANLGSALTPLGNPQNLYLYSLSGMSVGRFLRVMAPVAGVSVLLLAGALLFIPRESLGTAEVPLNRPNRRTLLLWSGEFLLCLLAVLRVVHFGIALGAVVLTALFLDRALLRRADYGLLLTFIFFFIFVGNIGAIPPVSETLSALVAGREMTVGILLSQIISNVPAAMLLSGFTGDYPALLLGVNLGGLGTLIASMASLISYKLYAAGKEASKGRYLAFFTAVNLLFLVLLWAAVSLLYGK
ncbi:MAG: citrate transporter [Angelakisella sp.]|nr:citrate transporter [Angelakisella sp.]